MEKGKVCEYPFVVQGAVYPIVINWKIVTPPAGGRTYLLSDGSEGGRSPGQMGCNRRPQRCLLLQNDLRRFQSGEKTYSSQVEWERESH